MDTVFIQAHALAAKHTIPSNDHLDVDVTIKRNKEGKYERFLVCIVHIVHQYLCITIHCLSITDDHCNEAFEM